MSNPTTPSDFNARLVAHRRHMAEVPGALALVLTHTTDFNGELMADGEAPRDGLTCGALRTLVAEVTRLQDALKQEQKDAREAEREFSREAREIASEARWQERQSHDGDYGSY